jgi:hypothetical protein
MTAATELTNKLLIELPKRFEGRYFRLNVSAIQAGNRFFRSAPPGMSDIIGITRVKGQGIFTAIEVKIGRDKLREEQNNFRNMVLKHNGIFIIARDLNQALSDLAAEVEARS